jgi:hypothetical protein
MFILLGCHHTQHHDKENYAKSYFLNFVGHTEQCSGLVDVRYFYANGRTLPEKIIQSKVLSYSYNGGSREKVYIASPNSNDNFISRRENNNSSYHIITLEGLAEHHKQQNDSNLCYAATLETVSSYFGKNYSQDSFVEALNRKCNYHGNTPLTANQIVYAATSVLGNSAWVIKTPNESFSEYMFGKMKQACPIITTVGAILNALNIVQGNIGCSAVDSNSFSRSRSIINVNGHTIDPGEFYFDKSNLYQTTPESNIKNEHIENRIFPVTDIDDLIFWMSKKIPVIAGIRIKGRKHVVIIDHIRFLPILGKDNKSLEKSYISEIGYLDPAFKSGKRIITGADSFLKETYFMMAVMM